LRRRLRSSQSKVTQTPAATSPSRRQGTSERPPREPWKDITYGEIATAVEQGGCPLCTLRDRGLYRALFPLLYELTNEPGVREHIRESRGFCFRHTWNLYEISAHDPLVYGVPVAIFYEDLLRQERESLSASHRPAGTKGCPGCEQEREIDALFIPKLRELLREPGFRAEWDKGGPLCLPHYWKLLEGQERAPWRDYVVGRQRELVDRLLTELREYLRKQDYRFQHELRRSDETAWIRALELMVGAPFRAKRIMESMLKT